MKNLLFKQIYEAAHELFYPLLDKAETNKIVDATIDLYTTPTENEKTNVFEELANAMSCEDEDEEKEEPFSPSKKIENVCVGVDETGSLPLYFLLDMIKLSYKIGGKPENNHQSIFTDVLGSCSPKNPEQAFNMMATKYLLLRSTVYDEPFNNDYFIYFDCIDSRTIKIIAAVMDLYWLGFGDSVDRAVLEDELYAEYLNTDYEEKRGKDNVDFFEKSTKGNDGLSFVPIDCFNVIDARNMALQGEYDTPFYNKLIRYCYLESYEKWEEDTERLVFKNAIHQNYKPLNVKTEFPTVEKIYEMLPDAGVEDFVSQIREKIDESSKKAKKKKPKAKKKGKFELTGRKELNAFFNDSIIDVVNNEKTYAKFGIGFPEPFILEGPPGCGKTYAVKQLEEYLGWETFHITSSSVGSQFIHETSKLIERTFENAAEYDKAMVVIDEMDSFMPKRTDAKSSDSHVIEEVNAFLKCLQTAQENKILVVGMTNFIENIDPAILRSGRMGTHITVSWPSEEEITQVLTLEMKKRPYDKKIDLASYAPRFKEKPLSDVTAVVRRASMTAARRRAKKVTKEDLDEACDFVLKDDKKEERRVIGFCA